MDYVLWQESQAFKKAETTLTDLFRLKECGKGNIFVNSFGKFKMFEKSLLPY